MPEQFIDRASLAKIRSNVWEISNTKKITLKDIEDRTGFSYSQAYRIIRGTNNMSVSGLLAVCKALEARITEVLNFDIEVPKYRLLRRERKTPRKG